MRGRLMTLCLWLCLSPPLLVAAAPQPAGDLTRLDPERPITYLEEGELLAAVAQSDEQSVLSRQVLAVGLALADRARQPTLAASMAIALADAEPDPRRAIELWDLALLLDPVRQQSWAANRTALSERLASVREDAGRAVYFIRNSDAREARPLFEAPGVRDAIVQTARRHGMDGVSFIQTLGSLLAHAENDACRGRIFEVRAQDGQAKRTLCRAHRRPIGAAPDDKLFRQMIILELALLAPGADQLALGDWAALAYVDRLAPADEPTIDMILEYYGVDAGRPLFDGAAWVARP